MRDYSARAMGFNPTEEKRRRTNLLSWALSVFTLSYSKGCPINDQEIASKYFCLGMTEGYAKGFSDGLNSEVIEANKPEEILDVVEPDPARKKWKLSDL